MNGTVAQLAEQETLNFEVEGSTPSGPTKICNKCKLEKSVNDFHRRKDKWQPYCKLCKKEHDAAYRLEHMDYFEERRRKQRKALVEWYQDLKRNPCVDCNGTFHPKAMQYDHLPGSEKIDSVSALLGRGSKRLVLEEIAKCELVCANCHAVRTDDRI